MSRVGFAIASTVIALCACGDNIKETVGDAAGNGSGSNTPMDAAVDAQMIDAFVPDSPPAQGSFYHYVASRVLLPATTTEATEYGLDLNGDGTVDNAVGKLLATLASQGGNPQVDSDEAVYGGQFTLLADIQTTDFTTAPAAGFALFSGIDPVPPACNTGEKVACTAGGVCTGCQHDLTGSGAFTVDPNVPANPALLGSITNGTFNAGPGALTLGLSIAGAAIELDLIGARIQASGITATAIGTQADTTTGVIIGGGIPQSEIDTKIDPAIATVLNATLMAGCTGYGSAGCTCTSSGAKTILTLFDTNGDCTIEVTEIENSTIAQAYLKPDVTLEGMKCLSIGVKAYAVGATYTVAGE